MTHGNSELDVFRKINYTNMIYKLTCDLIYGAMTT